MLGYLRSSTVPMRKSVVTHSRNWPKQSSPIKMRSPKQNSRNHFVRDTAGSLGCLRSLVHIHMTYLLGCQMCCWSLQDTSMTRSQYVIQQSLRSWSSGGRIPICGMQSLFTCLQVNSSMNFTNSWLRHPILSKRTKKMKLYQANSK